MKNILLLSSIILLLSFGQQEQSISGTLYFKLTEFVSLYGQEKDKETVFDMLVSELKAKKKLTQSEKEFVSQVDFIKKQGLIRSPYIKLKTPDDKIALVFMNEKDYIQFSGFKREKLLAENKKVNVDLSVTELSPQIYMCKKVIAIEKQEGLTPWDK